MIDMTVILSWVDDNLVKTHSDETSVMDIITDLLGGGINMIYIPFKNKHQFFHIILFENTFKK